MTKEEMQAALAEELKSFKEKMPTYVSPEDLEKKLSEFESKMEDLNMKDELKELRKAVEEQGTFLRSIKGGDLVNKTFNDILNEKEKELKELADNKNASIRFTVDKATVLTTSVADSTLAYRDTRIGQIQRPRDVIRQLFNAVNMPKGMGGIIRYVEQATNVNGAAMQTEGSKKGEGSITWIEKMLPLQTVAEWIKVSRQALDNFSYIASEIRNKLIRDLQAKVDSQLWNGTGTAPNLKGVYTSAGTYTAAASGITDANLYDLLIKVVENIAAETEYMPNIAVMNLVDINKLRLKKDANNNYVFPTFAMSDGRSIAGLTIVESSKVTANTMLVGDFSYADLYAEGAVEIQMGYENDDFTKNLVTILAEEKLGLLVREGEAGAFNKVTNITDALTTLAS